jgi:hypothetical protein
VRAEGGDRADDIPARKYYEDVSCARWRFTARGPPPPRSRRGFASPEKRETTGTTAQSERETTMKPMRAGTGAKTRVVARGGDSPLEIPASAPLLNGEESAALLFAGERLSGEVEEVERVVTGRRIE